VKLATGPSSREKVVFTSAKDSQLRALSEAEKALPSAQEASWFSAKRALIFFFFCDCPKRKGHFTSLPPEGRAGPSPKGRAVLIGLVPSDQG
jgi:hypothetical protein